MKWEVSRKRSSGSFSHRTLLRGQNPVAESPFCARCLPLGTLLTQCPAGQWMMGADHGAVDHLEGIRRCPALIQGVHNVPPRDLPASSGGTAGRRWPICRTLREGHARGTGPGDPENPIKNKTVVGRFAPVRRTNRARTARINRSKNAHSSSDIRSRAKLISIADTSLNHACTAM